ncbi:hypothetical protein [Maricaulis parjimensis]|uniref:hypothetical protein n=1 Tax=Maricaulis parjimensis TaxID=144023 RepID=UPI00193A7AE9|nr:hypothetical protein [Maricaulis parjimensis]
MTRSYSMEGVDMRIHGSVLEIRTEGERTHSNGSAAANTFESFLTAMDPPAVLFDIRGAHYLFSDLEWQERARSLARMCQGRVMSVVDRDDQSEQTRLVLEIHRERGGKGRVFRSRAKALQWLEDMVART